MLKSHILQFQTELHPVQLCIGTNGRQHAFQHFLDIRILWLQFQLSVRNLAEIQGIIDERQHELPRALYFRKVFGLLLLARRMDRHIRKAQNAIERRAHIMAHIRHEGRPCGAFPLRRKELFILFLRSHIRDKMRAGKAPIPGNPLLLDIEVAVVLLHMAHQFLAAPNLQAFQLAVRTDVAVPKHVAVASFPRIVSLCQAALHRRSVCIQEFLRLRIADKDQRIHFLQKLQLGIHLLRRIRKGNDHDGHVLHHPRMPYEHAHPMRFPLLIRHTADAFRLAMRWQTAIRKGFLHTGAIPRHNACQRPLLRK